MLERIIGFSLKYDLIFILMTLTVAGFGIYAIFNSPVGAIPDTKNNQVQVITTSNNLSTQEIEQLVTAPVELEMANLPGVKEIRFVSKFCLSIVNIVFLVVLLLLVNFRSSLFISSKISLALIFIILRKNMSYIHRFLCVVAENVSCHGHLVPYQFRNVCYGSSVADVYAIQ